MQHWVDARRVITEVNYRIHHPEDQRFREEDLEEIVYWTKGGADLHIFTMGTVRTDQEEEQARTRHATKEKGTYYKERTAKKTIK